MKPTGRQNPQINDSAEWEARATGREQLKRGGDTKEPTQTQFDFVLILL